jgi:magnesium-transporting ATPase (P-type)
MDEGLRVLQASSPDEIALVKFAESLGFVMKERDINSLVITNPCDEE